MSSYFKARSTPRPFRPMLAPFLQHAGLPFADALPEEAIREAFNQEHVRFGHDRDGRKGLRSPRRNAKPAVRETAVGRIPVSIGRAAVSRAAAPATAAQDTALLAKPI